jgi:hypothetical protein
MPDRLASVEHAVMKITPTVQFVAGLTAAERAEHNKAGVSTREKVIDPTVSAPCRERREERSQLR